MEMNYLHPDKKNLVTQVPQQVSMGPISALTPPNLVVASDPVLISDIPPKIMAMMQPPPLQQPSKSRNKQPKIKKLPEELEKDGAESNKAFIAARADPDKVFVPYSIGFIPSGYWANSTTITFGDLVTQFFQKKNNANCRFPQKLFNALTLVDKYNDLYPLIGVKWISDDTFIVDKYIFGRLLGITTCDGALFHSQGNFPSHGFTEVLPADVSDLVIPLCVDYDRVRVIRHTTRQFTRTCGDDFVSSCKWEKTMDSPGKKADE